MVEIRGGILALKTSDIQFHRVFRKINRHIKFYYFLKVQRNFQTFKIILIKFSNVFCISWNSMFIWSNWSFFKVWINKVFKYVKLNRFKKKEINFFDCFYFLLGLFELYKIRMEIKYSSLNNKRRSVNSAKSFSDRFPYY